MTKPIAFALALVLAGCGEREAANAAACQAPPPPEAATPEAMEKITLDAMRAALEGRDPPDMAARSAARRQVVEACLHRAAYVRAEGRTLEDAAQAAVTDCGEVIDGYIKAEAAEAALAGEIPPTREGMAQMRAELSARAAARAKEAQAGRCWRLPR